jgi:hypothetical protein
MVTEEVMRRRIFVLHGLCGVMLVQLTLWAWNGLDGTEQFAIEIIEPSRDGIQVGKGMNVRGRASLPSGYHLWVLAHRADFEGVWWPQAEGKIDPKTGEWKVYVTFGERQDIGWDFEIAAIVVAEEGHILLQNYRKEAMKTGDWKPIEVPPNASAPQIRKVKKVNHN